MSEQANEQDRSPAPPNRRLHILIGVAVLVGAIILLSVTECASLTGKKADPDAPPADASGPG
jgi:hypothetical protein